MKIGILTHFHKSINYGGVLQAYALCKYLNNQGYLAKQILYNHQTSKIGNATLLPSEFAHKVISRLNSKLYRNRNNDIRQRMQTLFWDFRNSIPHTNDEYNKDNIGNVGREFDLFITGSDQVWNPIWHDPSYMLDFVMTDIPKISYAASIGVNQLDQSQKNVFKTYLRDFCGISVREKEAADTLSSLLNRKVNVCVDPTLLLSSDEWNEVASKRKIDEKYVFLYFLGEDLKSRKLAEKFAKKKGLKLIMISDLLGKYRSVDRKIKADEVVDATPADFISLIKNAEYVFTDSFHACVFSLLYQRDFFVFQRKGKINMESRIQNLVKLFECSERFCNDKHNRNLDYLISLDSIDYKKEFRLFIKEKNESINFLKNILN